MERTSLAAAIWSFLGSKTLNVFLLVSGSAYGVMLTAWGATSTNVVVLRLAGSAPMKLLLTLFVVNNLLCLTRHFALAQKASQVDDSLPTVIALGKKRNHLATTTPVPASELISDMEARFRARRYQTIRSRDGLALRATRWRFSSYGTIFFHSAMFLVVLGMIIGPNLRAETAVLLAEGDSFNTGQTERPIKEIPAGSAKRLPDFGFEVKSVRPNFWRDQLLFTDLRAKIRPLGRNKSANVMLSSAYKPSLATYVTLTGVGYAPHYNLKDESGAVIEDGYVNLAAFPPGAKDSFSLSSLPYEVHVQIFPDATVRNGKIVNHSNNIRRPIYRVSLTMKGQHLATKSLRPGEDIHLGRVHLSFPKMVYWGRFKILYDPGVLFIWLGFMLGLAALVWRLLFIRKDFTILCEASPPPSRVFVHGQCDYYPHLIKEDVRTLTDLIENWPDRAARDRGNVVDAD